MQKVAIFTEGQSEQIFVRYFLGQTINWGRLSFKCVKLNANTMVDVPFDYDAVAAQLYFLIVNVGNDEAVLSAIKDREKGLLGKGYEKIIALRDMYSEGYCKRSPSGIDDTTTRAFIDGWHSTIQKMSDPSKIKMHVAIMELEAWFLGMYDIFVRIDPNLSVDYIESKFGFNLKVIDPQKEFFHPVDVLASILGLVGWQYDKSRDKVESICSRISPTDFCNVFENSRCASFRDFYEEMLNYRE